MTARWRRTVATKWFVPTPWLLWLAVAIWMFIAFYLVHWGWRWDLDLEVYRAAGHSLHAGSDPYLAVFTNSRLPFTYPPFALLLLSPLSLGRTGIVEAGWWVVNAAALVAILYLALRSALGTDARRAFALAGALGGAATMALEPLRSNMDYGQINLLIMLLVMVDITRVRAPWRGLLVGIAYMVRVWIKAFFAENDLKSAVIQIEPISIPERAGALLLLGATVLIGLWPGLLLNLITPTLHSPLFQRLVKGGLP